MTDRLYDLVIETLRTKKAAIRCSEVVNLLESLGFRVSSGKSPGHKVYTHPGLAEFYSASFNCDHGKNPQIKSAYVTNILRVLNAHETALRATWRT